MLFLLEGRDFKTSPGFVISPLLFSYPLWRRGLLDWDGLQPQLRRARLRVRPQEAGP